MKISRILRAVQKHDAGDIRSLTLALWFTLSAGCDKGQPPPAPPEEKAVTVKLSDLPSPDNEPFKVRAYVRAAAQLQNLGREKACKFLEKRAGEGDGGQIVLLCRMLFSNKAKGKFRPPRLGAPNYIGGTGVDDWPLLPIELVDDVPFFIVRWFDLGGEAESSLSYIMYCLENCEWSNARFDKVTDKTIEQALQKLLASKKWKKPLTDSERQYLSSQIK
jgi:hypothetical protein